MLTPVDEEGGEEAREYTKYLPEFSKHVDGMGETIAGPLTMVHCVSEYN